jgi:hypothetical protein
VLEENYYTNSVNKDTVNTFTESLKKACCHGWSIGTYKVSNDTVFFAAKPGYQENWTYYTAKIYQDNISIFSKQIDDRNDTLMTVYRKNIRTVVLKTIKL